MKIRLIIAVCLVAMILSVGVAFYCIHVPKPRVRFWAHHGGEHGLISSLVFSPDGTTLFAADSQKTTHSNLAPLRRLRTFHGAGSVISPDGAVLATIVDVPSEGRMRKAVKLWDVATGKELFHFDHAGFVWSIAFAPQRSILASGCEKGSAAGDSYNVPGEALLWDIKTQNVSVVLKGHQGPFCTVVFSPDGRVLASGGYDKTIRIWDLESGLTTRTLRGHSDKVLSVAFSLDGKVLASSAGGIVKTWDVNTGKELLTLHAHTPDSRFACSISFHPDGQILATGGRKDGLIKGWDVVTGEQRFVLRKRARGERGVNCLVFSPDGRTLAAGIGVGQVELWDVPCAN